MWSLIGKGMVVSFLTTEVIELILGAALGCRSRRQLRWIFLANLITNPAVNLLCGYVWFTSEGRNGFLAALAAAEAAAVIVEAILYERKICTPEGTFFTRTGRGWTLSAVLNLASFFTGVLAG